MTRWQRSVTLKAIRANKVQGFDCGYVAKEEDLAGKMEPYFRPFWEAQLLADGTARHFDTIKECQIWLREWGDIGR